MNPTSQQHDSADVNKTTVAICTRNRGALITATLESILAGLLTPDEILVVDQSDNSSTADAVLAVAARFPETQGYPPVRLLRTNTRGLSRARNVALVEAVGDIIAFTDDDVIVHSDWLSQAYAEFVSWPDLALLYGTVLAPDSYDWRTEFIPYTHLSGKRSIRWYQREALRGMGANMTLRRSICMPALSGFDVDLGAGSDIPTGEDIDYALRALCHRPKPLRLHTTDTARVVHHAGARRGEEYRRFVRESNGVGMGLLWGHMLRRGVRERQLKYMGRFLQETAWIWAGFLRDIARGRRPSGGITYAHTLTALVRSISGQAPSRKASSS